tara:strand:+ start:83 stop:184 length:102 start_codon:yes stop_codon:yes gene_type:complete
VEAAVVAVTLEQVEELVVIEKLKTLLHLILLVL